MLIDCMCQEKRVEEDLPALKTMLTHRYGSKTLYKNTKWDWLQLSENDTDNTMATEWQLGNKNKKENNSMGVLKRLINNISHDKTWTWLRKGNFKRETDLS